MLFLALIFLGEGLSAAKAVAVVLIAFSRLYLYVHYPTDILGGIAVGVLCGYIGARCVQHFSMKTKTKTART